MGSLPDDDEAVEVRQRSTKDVSVMDVGKMASTMAEDGAGGEAVDGQTRIRRLFSFSQLFAFSLTYMAVWEGMCTNMWFALYNGGPNTFVFSNMIAFVGALTQAGSIAEMASIQPIAGAQYHWTHHLAPQRVKRFATWIQGWATWFGYVSLLAGIANGTIILLEATIQLNHAQYVPGGWHTSVLVIAMCILQGLVNMYAFRVIPWVELVASGWDRNEFVSWNVGMLSCVWSFTGFDSAIHMSEETRRAKSAVPRAIFWSIFMNGILAFVMVIMLLLVMSSVEDAVNSASPILTILLDVTDSIPATSAMIMGLFIIAFNVNLACMASVSRLTWAWARDGGLHMYLAYVHPKHRVPTRAVALTVFLICALCLLNIGSGSYIAFGAITALSSLGLYLSYAIAISSMLYARWSSSRSLKLGNWNLGRWGAYINAYALVYTLYMMIWLPFPTSLPVTAANMNYCGPVMVFVLLVAVALWFGWARKNWPGPNLTILEFVMAHS